MTVLDSMQKYRHVKLLHPLEDGHSCGCVANVVPKGCSRDRVDIIDQYRGEPFRMCPLELANRRSDILQRNDRHPKNVAG